MFAIIVNYIQSTIILCKLFANFFSIVSQIKAIHALWTTEGRKRYPFTLRLWLSLIILLHFCSLIVALTVILGLSLIASPLVTAAVNITALIKNLAGLISHIYHVITCKKKIRELKKQLALVNINFDENLSFFEEIKKNIKNVVNIEDKISKFKAIQTEIINIQTPSLFDKYIVKLKKQIYEEIELDELIILHLQSIDNNKEKLVSLIENLSTEINELEQENSRNQDSISYLKLLPKTMAEDFKNDIESLKNEIKAKNSYRYKLKSLSGYLIKIKNDLDRLELLHAHEKTTDKKSSLIKQIHFLENKIKDRLKPRSLTKDNRFFSKIVTFFKETTINCNHPEKKNKLLQLLKEELTLLSQELISINLEINDKWQQNIAFANNPTHKTFINNISEQILHLKKQKMLAKIEKEKATKSVLLGMLLAANAILICYILNGLLIGILTVSMLTLTIISVFTDFIWYFKRKNAEDRANIKLRKDTFEQLEKMQEAPNFEKTLQKKLNAAFQYLNETNYEQENALLSNAEYFNLYDRSQEELLPPAHEHHVSPRPFLGSI